MGIVGDRPESGVRITATRAEAGPPWRYEGTAATPDAEFALVATIDERGEVAVEVGAASPPELAEKVRLILRAVVRQADGAPARKVVRWRPDI